MNLTDWVVAAACGVFGIMAGAVWALIIKDVLVRRRVARARRTAGEGA